MDTGTYALPDIEGGLKAFFRANDPIAALVGNRVFLGMPIGGPKKWPALVIHRIGGGPQDADYPMDLARIQIDVWHDTGNKIACQALAALVASTLINLPSGTLLSSAVRAFGFSQFTVPYVPDPETGRARYAVNCVAQAQAVPT